MEKKKKTPAHFYQPSACKAMVMMIKIKDPKTKNNLPRKAAE